MEAVEISPDVVEEPMGGTICDGIAQGDKYSKDFPAKNLVRRTASLCSDNQAELC
jgi:hypothetical protein